MCVQKNTDHKTVISEKIIGHHCGRRKAFEEVVGRHDRWFGLVGFGGGAQPQVGH